ncbi:MAG: hypothetical protein EOO90_21715 [Pedobacter sp.]|nr:MAG: hypothetical protein EOO90_21715 [Pedobacter sp.]
MDGFLDYLQTLAIEYTEDKEALERVWDNPILSATSWNNLAQFVVKRIDQYGIRLKQSKKLFATQLFNSDVYVFTLHCLRHYIDAKRNTPVFARAVKLFF